MLVPIYGFVKGDTLGVLVLVNETDTIERLTAVLLEAVAMRVLPVAEARAYAGGRRLDPRETVADAGLTALDRVDLMATP